jgi:two-component system, response regulator YesN
VKYTVFFVEDEITIREKIRESIDWNSTDFEYLGDAPDGEIALTHIAELRPDIVITDIRMPHMDGLDLCRGIQHECPDTYIIILSGYNDFEYAQKAINLNVSEYLLKPITPAKLISSLNNAARKVAAKREDKDELKSLKKELMDSRLILKERFLQGLMTETNPVDAILKADEFGLNLRSSYYSVLVFRSKAYLGINELIQTLQDLGYDFPVFRVGYREAAMIAMSRNVDQMQEMLKNLSNDLCATMLFLSNPMQIESGHSVNRISMLSKSFQNACMRIDSPPGTQVTANSNLSNEFDELHHFQGFDKKVLEDFLNVGLLSDLDAFLDSYLMIFLHRKSDRKFSLYLLFHLTFVFKSFMEKLNIRADTIPNFTDYSDKQFSIADIREQSKSILMYAITTRDTLKNNKNVSFLSEVRQKIDNEFSDDDISLKTLAKSVNVSPSYLSTTFKQHYHKTISKYLIEKRLNKAMELMRTTNMSISDISSSVGYLDANYFSVLFKKRVGKTPREYRKEK